MSQKQISELSVMDKMVQENNNGIRVSINLFSVYNVGSGSVIGFPVENEIGDDAKNKLIGLPGKNMLMCFAINREEFSKTKLKITHEEKENSVSRMVDRFDQLHCAQIRNLYWLMCQYENVDLKEMLSEMCEREFDQCFPGVLSNPYTTNIQDDQDEIICTLYNAGFSGLIAKIEYPKMEAFEFREDGSYKSCSINGNYMQYGYVYAETKEELLQKIEVQSEEMVEYWIEEHQNKIAEK